MRTVVLMFHPYFDMMSRANKAFMEAAQAAGIEVRNMYKLYPDFNIDVAKEQEVLLNHDRIVFQFPFFWYQAPALLAQYEEVVYQHGWAYATGGDKLKGKEMLYAVTCGAKADDYTVNGSNGVTAYALLDNYHAACNLIQTKFLEPFFEFGTLYKTDEQLAERAREYAAYIQQENIPAPKAMI